MIRTAVIGLGKMGISHASIVGAHPDVDLVAVCDTSTIVTSAFKKFGKMSVYTDYKKLFQKEKLDAVIIAIPTKLHYAVVKEALDRNINVFCEKPFTLSLEEGNELVKLAEDKNLINQVGYHNHFIGTFIELKRLLDKGVIGEILHFTGEAYGPVVTKEKGSTWRSQKSEGGGCLYDYASHVINLIQEILGRPVKAEGTLLKSFYSKGVEDAVYSLLKLKTGLTGVLSVNWSDETYRKMSTSLTVYGKKGKIICDATEVKIFLKEKNNAENLDKGWTIKYITDLAIPVDFHLRGEEYSSQLDYFIKNIKNNQKTKVNTFEIGHYTDRVINMIFENA